MFPNHSETSVSAISSSRQQARAISILLMQFRFSGSQRPLGKVAKNSGAEGGFSECSEDAVLFLRAK
jgi:hypothetical protein